MSLSIECEAGNPICPSDGDLIESRFSFVASEIEHSPFVTIVTEVQAVPSCRWTRVAVIPELGVLFHDSSQLEVRIWALDADNLPIIYSQPKLTVLWGSPVDSSQSLQNSSALDTRRALPGTHEYMSVIPLELRQTPGHYKLIVQLVDGWNSENGNTSTCDIFEHAFSVLCADGFTQVMSAGTPQCKEGTFQTVTLEFIVVLLVALVLVTVIAFILLRWWYARSATTAAKRSALRKALCHKLQKQYAMTGTLGPMDQVNADGDLPIHYAAECAVPCTLLSAILSSYPAGAKTADAQGNLPLHLLLRGLSSQSDWKEASSLMRVLLEAFPAGKVQADMHSKLPIQIFLDVCPPAASRHEVGVELGFPFDCNGGADNWLCLLAHSPPKAPCPPKAAALDCYSPKGMPVLAAEWLVEAIIKYSEETRRATIQQLAYATDAAGREAWAVATKANRKCLSKYLLFCGRYATLSSAVPHTVQSCAVYTDSMVQHNCHPSGHLT